jgi:hypothetical protein
MTLAWTVRTVSWTFAVLGALLVPTVGRAQREAVDLIDVRVATAERQMEARLEILRAQAAAHLDEGKDRERELRELLAESDALWAALSTDQREALVAEAALRLPPDGQALLEGFLKPAAKPLRSLFDPCMTELKSLAFSYRAFLDASNAALERETESLKNLRARLNADPSLTLYEAYQWSRARARLLIKLGEVVRLRMKLEPISIRSFCGGFLAALPMGRAPEYWAEARQRLSQTARLTEEALRSLNQVLVAIVDLGR